jgi:hypothetical protein
MTTKRWMATVLVVGAGLAVIRWTWEELKVMAAIQKLEAAEDWYAEGRITAAKYQEISKYLMELLLERTQSRASRLMVIEGHRDRAKRIFLWEQNDFDTSLHCHSGVAYLIEARDGLAEAEALLAREQGHRLTP